MAATGFEAHTTGYGPPASGLLAAQIEALKAGDVLAPVTVIVASDYAGISVRRSIAGRPGGLAATTLTTLPRMAERLASARLAAAGRRPVSGPVLAAAVREVLTADPGVFDRVSDHPATEMALVSAYRELAGLSGKALEAVAGAGQVQAEVVRVSTAARSALHTDWYDERDLLLCAAEVLMAQGPFPEPVIVHLLQQVSWAEAAVLQALSEQQQVTVNVGLTGDGEADRSVIEAHRRAGMEPPDGQVAPARCSAIVSVSDPDEEVRAAVRLVAQWMSEGVPLGRIAVLYGSADPYARLVHAHLEASGIPHSGAPVEAVGEMFLGRTVRGLLRLPDRGFRRSDVLGLVTGSGLLDGDRPAPARAWQRISREAGVVSGSDWSVRLAAFAAQQHLRAEEADRDEDEVRARHLRMDRDRAQELASFVSRLEDDVGSVALAGTWRRMAETLLSVLERWVGDERRRRSWPQEEVQATRRVEEAIERLAFLDALGGSPPGPGVFRRALEVELESAPGKVGRLGVGVLTATVGAAVGVETDRLVMLGMAEGTFPPRRLDDTLLPDGCRLRTEGELPLRAQRHHDDHRHLLAAMASAGQTVLVFPRGGLRRNGDRPASRWLLDDAASLAGRERLFTEDLGRLSEPWLTTVPSYAAGMASSRFPAAEQDLRLAKMLVDLSPVIESDAVLRAGMELSRGRRSGDFTRFDGNLGGADLPDYTAGIPTSATRLQTWAKCPHAFFMNYLLGVEVIDEPERRLEMSPLDRGALIHEILEKFIAERITSGGRGPWDAAAGRLEEIAEEVFSSYELQGLTGRGSFQRSDRQRMLRDLLRFAAEDRGRPIHAELAFEEARYRLPDGREVRFRGSIDRVDEPVPDRLQVLDYKTGSARSYKGLSALDPHQGGSHLQLAVYAAAARQALGREDVEAFYWFVTDRGNFSRVGYPVTSEVHETVGAVIATIVDNISAGVFPKRPSDSPPYHHVECWYCSPDGLSTAEVRRDWERKRLAAELHSYASMAEPEAVDAGG